MRRRKESIQALDPTHLCWPMKRDRGAAMTHDYKRNGTATLSAALNTSSREGGIYAWSGSTIRSD